MDLTVFGDKRFKFIMICSFVWGVVAHGMEMFHKFSYHDDAMWVEGFADHETYGLGRWGQWQHFNSDVCIKQAMEFAEKI